MFQNTNSENREFANHQQHTQSSPFGLNLSFMPSAFHQQQEDVRKHLFSDAAAQLMHLYKESIRRCEDSYYQGKEDALEEVLKWFLAFKNGDFKHVSVQDFFNFLSSKLNEHRQSKRRSNQQASNTSSAIPQSAPSQQSFVRQNTIPLVINNQT